MRKSWLLAVSFLVALAPWAGSSLRPATAGTPTPTPTSTRRSSRLPVRFEENRGQFEAGSRFVARGGGTVLTLTREGARLRLRDRAGAGATLGFRLSGARSRDPVAEERLETRTNYFLGSNPADFRTDVPSYRRVRYSDVLPGVDVVYHGDGGSLEYDVVVGPRVAIGDVTMEIDGADSVAVRDDGALELRTSAGRVVQPAPQVYQEIDGGRTRVEAKYILKSNARIAFSIGAYDVDRTLVIDPVLVYATYLGGTDYDEARALAVDSSGNVFVTGRTYSADFPTKAPIDATYADLSDTFVAKLDASGASLVWSTYIGGSSNDDGHAIALDAAGNVYLGGRTQSSDFPVTAGAYQTTKTTLGGDAHAFIAKIGPLGSSLLYATYFGANGDDYLSGIAVDASGSAFVAGDTYSNNFTMVNAIQSGSGGKSDAFVAKLNPAGSALVYSTYLGGSGDEVGGGLALDAAGAAYITGKSSSPNFPTVKPIQATRADTDEFYADVFVAKLNPGGSALVYSTYLGGQGNDWGRAIAVDTAGNAFVTGTTFGRGFPVLNPIPPVAANAGYDAFVTKVRADGTLGYSTLLGGTGQDEGLAIVVDSAGNANVAGETFSTDFPMVNPVRVTVSDADGFVARLSPSGSRLLFSTYLGGATGRDSVEGIALGSAQSLVVIGTTEATDLSTDGGAQLKNAGKREVFVAKLDPPPLVEDGGPEGGIADAEAPVAAPADPDGGLAGRDDSASDSGESSGCGCRASGAGPSRLGALFAVVGILTAYRRRRAPSRCLL